ncbi:MAG: penicillin-binding protein 1B [Gammaproteobacteria bacterium]|nr:penicillin-binding protein 1B [Gammaproteobacteria bacterium]
MGQKKGQGSSKKAGAKTTIKSKLWYLFSRLTLLLVIAAVAWVAWLDIKVLGEFSGKKWSVPARVYARPMELYPGATISSEMLAKELAILGYRRVSEPSRAGQFKVSGDNIHLISRPFRFWDGDESARELKVRFEGGRIAALFDPVSRSNTSLARLDPALIGSIYPSHGEDRILVRLDQVPEALISALIATEDRRFYDHWGVDPKSIGRAFVANVRAGGYAQGGSTITQQLVKNFFLDSRRTLVRKANEAVMALLLELHFSKEEILEAYLNEIYFGQDGARSIHGFGLAAWYWFQTPLEELSLHEIALLVGMVKGPSYYNPRRAPERALNRRNTVLELMADTSPAWAQEVEEAKAQSIDIVERSVIGTSRHPAFIQLVRQQLQRDYRSADLESEGLRIYTTFDPLVQRAAEHSVKTRLKALEQERNLAVGSLQAAAVFTTTETAEVLAVVGGRDPRADGFNRALAAKRPIGSLVKPAVVAAALAGPEGFTLASRVNDEQVTVKLDDGREWTPKNYSERYWGEIPLYDILVRSLNAATVDLGMTIGVPAVIAQLRQLGLAHDPEPYPSLLLGALELSPLEVASLYQPISAGGYQRDLSAIREVRDAVGAPLQRYPLDVEQAMSTPVAALLRWNLQQTVERGSARALGWLLPEVSGLAGKTGTTNDLRDGWFAGFGGNMLGVVWVGRDDNKSAGLTGASGALRVWAEAMSQVALEPIVASLPSGAEWHAVNPDTGALADGCANTTRVPFLSNRLPLEEDSCMQKDSPGLLKRIFNWFE